MDAVFGQGPPESTAPSLVRLDPDDGGAPQADERAADQVDGGVAGPVGAGPGGAALLGGEQGRHQRQLGADDGYGERGPPGHGSASNQRDAEDGRAHVERDPEQGIGVGNLEEGEGDEHEQGEEPEHPPPDSRGGGGDRGIGDRRGLVGERQGGGLARVRRGVTDARAHVNHGVGEGQRGTPDDGR